MAKISLILFFMFTTPIANLAHAETASVCDGTYPVSPAATPPNATNCRILQDVLYVDGEINDELVTALQQAGNGIRRLELNSLGGYTESAYKIAELVRSLGIETDVRAGATCESACTLVYQSGAARFASPQAHFMFHGSRIGKTNMLAWLRMCSQPRTPFLKERCDQMLQQQIDLTVAETEKFFSAFLTYDASPAFFDRLKQRPQDPDWFMHGNFTKYSDWELTGEELHSLDVNIVQQLL